MAGSAITDWEIIQNTDLVSSMMDVIPHPIFFKDKDGRYLGCNQQFCAMLGVERENILGRTVFEVAPSDLAQVYHDADMKLMAEGGTQRYASSVRYGDGIVRRGVFFKAVYNDTAGHLAGLVGMFYPMEFLLDVIEM
ncbi:diguanylate cyclase [Paramagnetospirillum marisnigri]|uniref:Diguanylate cyclase n=1 Tax=Paramagnetospirillum marisnigri TaxID=1285242 RepID=A0A178M4L6_9PROT|nr:PAS domain-containing protein [Paramagnetospirillum marisnigri]OAN43013.1 diguanylate cyclase [Paramagnetospirillum marisnigri]